MLRFLFALGFGALMGAQNAAADFCSDMSKINDAATADFSTVQGALKDTDTDSKTFVADFQPDGAQNCEVRITGSSGSFSCWWPLTSGNKKQDVEELAGRTAECLGVSPDTVPLGDEKSAMSTFQTSSADFDFRSEVDDGMISMVVMKVP
jgi:hypothetical protein